MSEELEFVRYLVRNVEPFKDGNVMEGRFLKAGEVLTVTALEKQRIEQSGGILEVLDTLIPNPKKHVEEPEETKPVEAAKKGKGKRVHKA